MSDFLRWEGQILTTSECVFLKVMGQKRLRQSHLASCPREPFDGLRVVAEPWCYPETPAAASLLVTRQRRDEYMFIIIRLYFLETVSNDPCGGAM